jgi:hypothetical protein
MDMLYRDRKLSMAVALPLRHRLQEHHNLQYYALSITNKSLQLASPTMWHVKVHPVSSTKRGAVLRCMDKAADRYLQCISESDATPSELLLLKVGIS